MTHSILRVFGSDWPADLVWKASFCLLILSRAANSWLRLVCAWVSPSWRWFSLDSFVCWISRHFSSRSAFCITSRSYSHLSPHRRQF